MSVKESLGEKENENNEYPKRNFIYFYQLNRSVGSWRVAVSAFIAFFVFFFVFLSIIYNH